MSEGALTPTQRRLLAVLADGLPHRREELLACLNDSQATYTNIAPHLTAIRKVLRPIGQDLICELYCGRLHYRHVRLLAAPSDGKR